MPFLQVLLCHMLTVLFGQMTKIHVFGKMLTPQVLLRPNANSSIVLLCQMLMLIVMFGQMTKLHVFGKMLTSLSIA